jgi:hypothetical protein
MEETNHKSHEWEPPLNFNRNLSSMHSTANGKPPRDRVARVIRKVDLNVTIASYNYYKLNAQSK